MAEISYLAFFESFLKTLVLAHKWCINSILYLVTLDSIKPISYIVFTLKLPSKKISVCKITNYLLNLQ